MGYETNDTGITPAAFGVFFYTDLANWSKGIGTLTLKKAQLKDSSIVATDVSHDDAAPI